MKNSSNILLNKNQLRAVKYLRGPLLIIAGAGTGKTLVITEKIKYLIKTKGVKPEQILALTFTDKAATEMEERVDQALPYGYFQLWIATFHSFAHQILRDHANEIGLSTDMKLMTEAETILYLKKNLFLFNLKYYRPLGNPNKFLNHLVQHFSRLKDEDISPDAYLTWVKSFHFNDKNERERYHELASAYERYQTLKIKDGAIDFSDLVYYLLILLRKRRHLLRQYQERFKYILVDEFQDTNIAQYQLLKLLSPPQPKSAVRRSNQRYPQLTVVGDDSQSIYKFRGASISNILEFMSDYPTAKQITLNINYRSNQIILNHAYRLIKHNDPDTLEARLHISKNLISRQPAVDRPIDFYYADRVEDEADHLAKTILSLNKTYSFSDCALLVRAANHSDPFINAFHRHGIPYQLRGSSILFKQPEVKDLIAYLKLLYNLEDSPSFYRILAMDRKIIGIDSKDLSLLLAFAKKINSSLFMAVEIILGLTNPAIYRQSMTIYRSLVPRLQKTTYDRLLTIYQMINRHLKLVPKETAGQILYYFLEDTGYLNRLANYHSLTDEKISLNISKFFSWLKAFETDHQDASIFAVVDYLEMSFELGDSPLGADIDQSEYDAVNIMTVHAAKGLEFPVVFLVNLTAGRFPSYARKEVIPIPTQLIKEILPQGDFHLQEERRLFYVGLTRAMDRVYLSASRIYTQGKRERKLSPFVLETLGEQYLKTHLKIKSEEKNQLSIFDFKKINLPLIKQSLSVKSFSYTQLETYKTCPLQYKYAYVIKIPTTPSAQLSFGSTIHRTLQKFYQQFISQPNINIKHLLTIYRNQWQPIGYASLHHQQRMKLEGEMMLKNFYRKFHHRQLSILALERPFKIKIAKDIFINGVIDRVDRLPKQAIEIIDYKTGKLPDEKQLKKNVQLAIYALAATNKGLFNQRLDKIRLTFYYLQDLQAVSVKKTRDELMQVKKELVETVDQIRSQIFPPNVGRWCDFCPYKIICEAWQ